MSIDKAIGWMNSNWNEGEGVIITNKQRSSYPEVTGYFIPTLLSLGFKKRTKEALDWLVRIQKEDGAISLNGPKFTFDTAQVAFGLYHVEGTEYTKAANKCLTFLKSQVKSDGSVSTEFHAQGVPPEINVWVAAILSLYKDDASADPIWKYYNNDKVFEFNKILHFYCYILDACLYGPDFVKNRAIERINFLAKIQRVDGEIQAQEGVDWICYPGVAQAACLFYKIGLNENGDRAVKYLDSIQLDNGGFLGSNGSYFSDQEPSWAVKFYMDAKLEHLKRHFEGRIKDFSSSVAPRDSRLHYLRATFKDFKGKTILDAGCAKGRFARMLMKDPGLDVVGIDIAENLLQCCPEGMITKQGSILDMPFSNEEFNGVYCIEVIEHIPNLVENAIIEMKRVLKPGGKLVIIDKDKTCLKTAKDKEEWEEWFDIKEVEDLMKKYLKDVKATKISSLFVAWEGRS